MNFCILDKFKTKLAWCRKECGNWGKLTLAICIFHGSNHFQRGRRSIQSGAQCLIDGRLGIDVSFFAMLAKSFGLVSANLLFETQIGDQRLFWAYWFPIEYEDRLRPIAAVIRRLHYMGIVPEDMSYQLLAADRLWTFPIFLHSHILTCLCMHA